jgi:trk system potassium uptake protein TrkA
MHYAVIGLGSFGYTLATGIHALGGSVIAIDSDEQLIEDIKDQVDQAVCLDATEESSLRALGMDEVDVAIVAVGADMQSSILVTALLRQIGVTRIYARAMSTLHQKVLLEVGASQVVRIEELMGEQLAQRLVAPTVLEKKTIREDCSIIEIKPKTSLIGQRVRDLNLREKFNLGLAAIEKKIPSITEDGKSEYINKILCPPDPDEIICRDDTLVIFGHDSDILHFEQEK